MSYCDYCGGDWGHYDGCPQKNINSAYDRGYERACEEKDKRIAELEGQVKLLKEMIQELQEKLYSAEQVK